MLQGVVEKGGDLRVEVADTNESKELMKFCRKFTVPLRAALREAGVLTNYETPKRPVVHVFFIAPGCCYTGYSYSNNNSPFYGHSAAEVSVRCAEPFHPQAGRGVPRLYSGG
jgi:23S rRNA (cytidine2498-2'-O)-methyltransferase